MVRGNLIPTEPIVIVITSDINGAGGICVESAVVEDEELLSMMFVPEGEGISVKGERGEGEDDTDVWTAEAFVRTSG